MSDIPTHTILTVAIIETATGEIVQERIEKVEYSDYLTYDVLPGPCKSKETEQEYRDFWASQLLQSD